VKLRLSGSARKSQKRFRDTPRFKFQAVSARIQPFLARSIEKRGDQSRFKSSGLYTIDVGRSRYIAYFTEEEASDLAGSLADGAPAGGGTRALKALRLVRLSKMLRVARIKRILSKYSDNVHMGTIISVGSCSGEYWCKNG
jgi:hypothetical protein